MAMATMTAAATESGSSTTSPGAAVRELQDNESEWEQQTEQAQYAHEADQKLRNHQPAAADA